MGWKKTYEEGILDFNKKIIATLKRDNKNKQFIYFSGIGIDRDSSSKCSKTIFKSEKYIL